MNIALRPQPTILETLSGRPVEVDILLDGYSMVKVDPDFLRVRLAAVRYGMQCMTKDAQRFQELFPYIVGKEDLYGKEYSKDIGLTLREDDEHKWFFHFAPEAYQLSDLPVPGGSVYHTFFEALHQLNLKAVEIAIAISERFDERNHKKSTIRKYPGSMAELIRNGWTMMRVLQYLKLLNWMIQTAKPHTDRGAWSIDFGASEPGLKILRNDGKWIDVDITKLDYVAVFPGRKIGAITRGALGDGTPHGVKYKHVSNRDRFAIVSFVHPAERSEDAQWLRANHDRIRASEKELIIP